MIRDNKGLDVAPASQPPLSHPSGAEPASAVSGKAGIANAVTFTPGPWGVHCSHIYAPDGAIIATVNNPGSKPDDYPLVANRDLMAAAPDFAEAAAALLSVFDEQAQIAQRIIVAGRSDRELREEGNRAIGALRAALAKAGQA